MSVRIFGLFALVAMVFGLSIPVHGYAPLTGFFNAGAKYREWYQETVWLSDTRTEELRFLGRIDHEPGVHIPVNEKYPYPDKAFVLTQKIWNDTVTEIEAGDPDWFDAEVVRQRAVMEGFPPAMDVLAWMYEHGRALDQNFREAFLWYMRAERAGIDRLRGNQYKIFTRNMTKREQQYAQIQLADEMPEEIGNGKLPGWDRINLQILAENNDGSR